MIPAIPIWKEFLCALTIPALVSIITIQGAAHGLPQPKQAPTTLGKQLGDTVQLTNSQPNTLEQFYASPSPVNTWQKNLLGSDEIASHESIQVALIKERVASCDYDIKAVLSDGTQISHYGIDLCDRTEYTF